MKRLLIAIVVLGVVLPVTVTLFSQSNDMNIAMPPDMLDTNIRNWQLNGVTLLFLIQVLGRVWSGLKNGGGIVGVWKGIVFGENVPKEVAQMLPSKTEET